MSGVSKAMVSQIERGESNPTVATLWKVALGLKISFSELITEKRAHIESSATPTSRPSSTTPPASKSSPSSPRAGPPLRNIPRHPRPHASHASDPHATHSEEYIFIIEGAIEIIIGSAAYRLAAGDAIHTHADKPHFYRNLADKPVRFLNIIYYGQNGEPSPVKPVRSP
jgi:transcriptional regulator with XRE-family HTH domain